MDQTTLQNILSRTQQHLATDQVRLLAERGLQSPLAFAALHLLEALHNHDDQDDVIVLLNDLVGREYRKTLYRALQGDPAAALRSLDTDPPLLAACQALVAALGGGAESERNAGTNQHINAKTATNVRQIVAGNYHEAPASTEEERQHDALLTYLAA